MGDLKTTFSDNAEPPKMMDADTYVNYLEKLLTQGSGYGKTENVGAFLMQDVKVQTMTVTGKVETTKNISVEKIYLVMDLSQYPLEETRGLIMKDTAQNWAGKIIAERDLNDPDFAGSGLWTLKPSSFDFDYKKAEESARSSVFKPNPEAYRVCLDIQEAISIPVTWDTEGNKGFTIEAGGALAIRERDIPALAALVKSVRSGEKTAAEALLTTSEKGNTLSKIDVYGMEPNFLHGDGKDRKANYKPVALKAETVTLMGGNKGGPSYTAGANGLTN